MGIFRCRKVHGSRSLPTPVWASAGRHGSRFSGWNPLSPKLNGIRKGIFELDREREGVRAQGFNLSLNLNQGRSNCQLPTVDCLLTNLLLAKAKKINLN